MMIGIRVFVGCLALWAWQFALAQTTERSEDSQDATESTENVREEETEDLLQATQTEVNSNENPEERRRAERLMETDEPRQPLEYDIYGSVRLHAINEYDPDTGEKSGALGDGASRIGVSGGWHFMEGWNLFGRLEAGFDVLDTFTSKAQNEENEDGLLPRLSNVGLESDWLYVKLGKSWSTYYKVAGLADRFAIFGGSSVGVYNAGTDGGATGTGRADDAVQTLFYIDTSRWTGIKPFNLNVQWQDGQEIPRVKGQDYGTALSLSAWFETENNLGVGLAWHRAKIHDISRSEFVHAGIDGDAQALAIAFKTYGDRWLASFVLAQLENIETTDRNVYFNGNGAELFAQWQFRDRWWLTGGANWLEPDSDSVQAGEYDIKYLVLGLRYTFDSFNRMLYAEWRSDGGTLSDGSPRKSEFTIGVRWDFGY